MVIVAGRRETQGRGSACQHRLGEPGSRLPPWRQTSPGDADGSSGEHRGDRYDRALVTESFAAAYNVAKIPLSGSAGLSCGRLLRPLFGMMGL
jgi:hypothetical protein